MRAVVSAASRSQSVVAVFGIAGICLAMSDGPLSH
jgi:hypothetical protein